MLESEHSLGSPLSKGRTGVVGRNGTRTVERKCECLMGCLTCCINEKVESRVALGFTPSAVGTVILTEIGSDSQLQVSIKKNKKPFSSSW